MKRWKFSILVTRHAHNACHAPSAPATRKYNRFFFVVIVGVAVTMLLLLNGDPMQLAAFLCRANCEQKYVFTYSVCVCVCAPVHTFIVSQVIKQFNIFPLSIRYTHFFSRSYFFPVVVSCIVDCLVAGCCSVPSIHWLRLVMIAASNRPTMFVGA